MIFVRVRRLFGIFVFLLALTLLIWGIFPNNKQTRTGNLVLPEVPNLFPSNTPFSTSSNFQPESVRVTLELPVIFRLDDEAVIRLSLDVGHSENQRTSTEVKHLESGNEYVRRINLYDAYNIMAEARLELAGIQALPSGEHSQPLRPDQTTNFFWNLRPNELGNYKGAVWLHLRYIPLNGGVEQRVLLANQLVEFDAVNLMGLGGTSARIIGCVGMVVGLLLALENDFSWIGKIYRLFIPENNK